MARRKIPYNKRATTYEEQITILRRHGVVISDEAKAKEYLADIGYYRLGFYLYPFELTYPHLDNRRQHNVKPGTCIEDVFALYYFDIDLRNILNKYLSRIEVAIRTTIVYELSNKYKSNPTWFVDSNVVSANFIRKFPGEAYRSIRNKLPIQRHHSKYTGQFAPAWKTMEYMTLGNLEVLYDSLVWDRDKRLISSHFKELAIETFKSYLTALREVRNACAHGNLLFGMTLSSGIRTGEACASFNGNDNQTFKGALRVIDYLLRQVSVNRANDMWREIYKATYLLYQKTPSMRPIVENQTGIIVPEKSAFRRGIEAIVSKIVNFRRKKHL
ncbi:Abi family protein [Muribaculaceae bacterium Isolate-042 (Harlan)]|nr:Abi family protein [Muribaculaceae bacterium Isolate-042 (Harlan)]